MRMNRRTLCLHLAALPAAIATIARPARAQKREPVTIALSSNSLAYGGLRIAEQLGLFERNGIAPRLVVLDSGSAATAALISNSAAFAGSGPAEVIAARVRGLDIGIVTNIYHGFAAPILLAASVIDKLAVKPQAPLSERFKALDGLTIAFPSATSALLTPVRLSAEDAGAKIRFVYLSQPTMAAALQAGAIQGYVASSPFWTSSVRSKAGTVWIDAPRGELPPKYSPSSSAVLETTNAYARANPDIVRRLRQVFADTAQVIKTNPTSAVQGLIKAFAQVDPETLKITFDHDNGNWSQPDLTEADMVQEIALLRQTGNLPGLDALKPHELFIA